MTVEPKKNSGKPNPYDLVSIFISREEDGKITEKKVMGWWMGSQWWGHRLKPSDTILSWERDKDCHG